MVTQPAWQLSAIRQRLRMMTTETGAGQWGSALAFACAQSAPECQRQVTKLWVWLYRRSGGAIGGKAFGAPVLLLTTTGRKTGRIWTTPLLYGREGDRIVVIASFAGSDQHPAWWLNLRGNKRGTVQLGTDTFDVVPREADDGERERLWTKMVVEVYRGFDGLAAKSTRRLPVVVLERA
jgi:F420H(2)-dependent quinone reductase